MCRNSILCYKSLPSAPGARLENFLFEKPESNYLKLIDFGNSALVGGSTTGGERPLQ